jgi:hypothetical protein
MVPVKYSLFNTDSKEEVVATIEQLEARMDDLRARRDDILAELKDVTAERNAIQDEEVAQQALEGLTENQRAYIIGAKGVASTAKVGKQE